MFPTSTRLQSLTLLFARAECARYSAADANDFASWCAACHEKYRDVDLEGVTRCKIGK
jgi:hypothetical protein